MGDLDNTPLVIVNNGTPPVDMTILTGQILALGSVLGIVTAGGKLKLTDSASVDGSENPKYVLLKAVDTSGGDLTGQRNKLLAAGIVNADKLVFGGTDTLADHHVALKETGIIAVDTESSEAYDNS